MFKKRHYADSLFALLLYGMFALLSLLLVLAGAQTYKHIVTESAARSDMRSTLSYVANKIRTGDAAGSIKTDVREGIDVLVLNEGSENSGAVTLIYCFDGMLCELLQMAGDRFLPAYGEKLIPVSDFSVTEENGLFTVSSRASNGELHSMYVRRRTDFIREDT